MMEAEKALRNLLDKESGENRARVLLLFLEFSMQTGAYKEAVDAIHECLQLDISEEIRSDLNERLALCRRKTDAVRYESDCNTPKLASFVESMHEFLIARSNSNHQFVKIDSWEQAERCAHDENIEPPFYSWNAVRTLASKETMGHVYERKIVLDAFNEKCLARIFKICEKSLPRGSPGYFYFDDIYADLSLIARGLLIDELGYPLAKMKTAYEMGLFPCGWKGSFPEGELVVYKLWGEDR